MIKNKAKYKNIAWVVKNGLCVKCGTCISTCPHGCLDIQDSFKKGYHKPLFIDRCKKCGLCLDVCPGFTYWFSEEEGGLGNCLKAFSGHATDESIRINSSSGGSVTAISVYLLEKNIVEGVITTRMSSNNPLLPEGFIAKTKEDVLTAVGSKYSPVPLNKVLATIDEDKKYAYIGLGCHLYGVKKFIRKRYPQKQPLVISLGLFCSRTPSINATKFMLEYNGIQQEDVSDIKYRGNGRPGKLKMQLKNGETKYIEHLDYSYWGFAFYNFFMQYRCWLCNDKSAVLADISFADDWVIPLSKDNRGSSSVVARTEAGLSLLNRLEGEGCLSLCEVAGSSVSGSQALERKINTFTRQVIARIFSTAIPKGCFFTTPKKLRLFSRELSMFFRIRLSGFPFLLQRGVIWLAYLFQKSPDYPCNKKSGETSRNK